MKVLLFVVVVILPNGQPHVNASAVSACPDHDKVVTAYQHMQIAGKILDWEARCYESGLKLPTRT